jgi:hypothetical protein
MQTVVEFVVVIGEKNSFKPKTYVIFTFLLALGIIE